jgi:hypothetical protein
MKCVLCIYESQVINRCRSGKVVRLPSVIAVAVEAGATPHEDRALSGVVPPIALDASGRIQL